MSFIAKLENIIVY